MVNLSPSRKLHALLHALAGGGCLAGAGLIRLRPDAAAHWQLLGDPLLAVGLSVLLLALLRRHPWIARLSTGLCLSLLVVTLTLTLLELGFRVAGFDFRSLESAGRALPPFYRKPTVPFREVFLRRPGPDSCRGQIIRTCLRHLRLPDAQYRGEPVVEVRYDTLGFRNEQPLSDWEVAVAGDSFTELGYLPYEQLFTSILARRTGWRVRNLGVSHTGPLTQLAYLSEYGVSAAAREFVVVFYEGNDLRDLDREQRAVSEFRRTGRHAPGEHGPQTSLLGALTDWLSGRQPPPLPEAVVTEGFWAGPDGDVPLTFENTAPRAVDLASETRAAFDRFLMDYAALAREQGARPWLAYMPCKLRVLFGRVRLTPTGEATIGNWSPTDLPQWVRERCAAANVQFTDLTPALVEALHTQGRLPFNPTYDMHLSAFGSEVVGQALARALQP